MGGVDDEQQRATAKRRMLCAYVTCAARFARLDLDLY